jgi:hypothetical protein
MQGPLQKREQGLTLFTAVLCLVAVVVILQLWLVAGALDALLGGEKEILVPAAIASLTLFLANGALTLWVIRLDRRIRRAEGMPE